MSTIKAEPIRTGHLCRVVNPEFVVRVGYPLTVQAETEAVLAEQGEFLRATVVRLASGFVSDSRLDKAVWTMAKEIAYLRCVSKGWGGKQRAIYRHTLEEWRGRTFHVNSVRFVKTGEYHPATTWEGEYEPAYLSNEKTHRILEIPSCPPDGTPLPTFSFLEIEAANVERVTEGQ